ncbi:MAG: WG repeat-containing protein [Clostridia bacterium]|nr:WG repeat-containing protein [Clostridia bacterium]
MDLFEEAEFEPKTKKKEKKKMQLTTILIIFIVILLILCVLIFGAIVYLKSTIFILKVDGKESQTVYDMMIAEENDAKFPIKQIAKSLGYESYGGNYETMSEDENKCYVKNDYEVTMITADSNKIYQLSLENTNSTKEKVELNAVITKENGDFYTNIEGIEKIFNVYIAYTPKKSLTIQTLDTLYESYTKYYQKQYTFPKEESYANKKLILDDLLIVQNPTTNLYGVLEFTEGKAQELLDTKYDGIEYLRNYSTFLVTKNNKQGIIDMNKKNVLEIEYNKISTIQSDDKKYYLVSKSGLMGLNDESGKIIIYPEYDDIGIDKSEFEKNQVTNNYILYDKYIPVCQNKKWALFDIEGNNMTGFKYDSFGSSTTTKGTSNVLLVPDYKLIVVKSDKKYNFLYDYENPSDIELFSSFELDSVYLMIQNGKINYYFTLNDENIEISGYLEQHGIKKVE